MGVFSAFSSIFLPVSLSQVLYRKGGVVIKAAPPFCYFLHKHAVVLLTVLLRLTTEVAIGLLQQYRATALSSSAAAYFNRTITIATAITD